MSTTLCSRFAFFLHVLECFRGQTPIPTQVSPLTIFVKHNPRTRPVPRLECLTRSNDHKLITLQAGWPVFHTPASKSRIVDKFLYKALRPMYWVRKILSLTFLTKTLNHNPTTVRACHPRVIDEPRSPHSYCETICPIHETSFSTFSWSRRLERFLSDDFLHFFARDQPEPTFRELSSNLFEVSHTQFHLFGHRHLLYIIEVIMVFRRGFS